MESLSCRSPICSCTCEGNLLWIDHTTEEEDARTHQRSLSQLRNDDFATLFPKHLNDYGLSSWRVLVVQYGTEKGRQGGFCNAKRKTTTQQMQIKIYLAHPKRHAMGSPMTDFSVILFYVLCCLLFSVRYTEAVRVFSREKK